MSGKITWLIIVASILNVKFIISQNEDDEDSGSLFNADSATIDALFLNIEEKSESDKFDNLSIESDQLVTTTMTTNSINDVDFACEKLNLTTTLVRYSNLLSKRKSVFDGDVDLLSCINYCKKNKEPLSNKDIICAGLNYFKNEEGISTCQIVDKFEVGDLERTVEDDNMNHWYQKICLNVKNNCKDKLILFDAIPNHKMKNGNVIKDIKSNIENCFELCASINYCYGINFLKDNNCQLIELNNFYENEDIEKDANFNFYRNECVKKKCLLNSPSFLVYSNTRIQSPKVLISSTSLEGCMKECISTDVINCKTVQFLKNKNECNMYDFFIFKMNPSQNVDIYKPVCLNIPLNRNCNKQFLYEVIEKTSVAEKINSLYFKIDTNFNRCLQECLDNEKCYIITFQTSLNKCTFYDASIQSINFQKSEDVDLYIIGCENSKLIEKPERDFESTSVLTSELFPTPTATLNNFELSSIITDDNILTDNVRRNDNTIKKNCFLNLMSKLVFKGKIFRQEFRIFHQKNVMNVTHCSMICKNSNVKCIVFAYSSEDKYCFLSKYSLQDLEKSIQENDKYDIWSLISDNNCLQNDIDDKVFGHVFDRTPKIFNKNNDIDFLIIDNDKSKVTQVDFVKYQSTTFKMPSSTETTTLSTVSSSVQDIITTNVPTNTEESFIIDKDKTKDQLKLTNLFNANLKIPQIMNEDDIFTKLLSSNLKVHVACYSTGANVTFNVISKNYTGAVYAAERFSHCKNVVQESNNFSLFIPRPRFNNSCNSIEINRQLTAIIVVSNDLVIPYDLTTKDDFFYEIKCEYSDKEMEEKVNNGFVVGRPESKIENKKDNEKNTTISLKVMRGDKPVEHVFIGEKLKAVLISDIEANNLNVIYCNASRVGGIDDKSNSIPLISNGCSLMPQIISDIGVGKYGLEANITAFRIDGSDHIDIICDVSICHNNCSRKLSCNNFLNIIKYEKKINKVNNKKRSSNLNETQVIEKRIHVLVDEEVSNLFKYQLVKQYEDSAITKHNTSSSFFHNFFDDNQCIDIHVFGVSIIVFLLIIIILISVISCSKKVVRKKYGVVAYTTS